MPRKYSEEEFAQKFWEKVDKTSDPQGCWLWTGYIHKGYGRVGWKNRKVYDAHRVAYLLANRVIPEGLQLAHSGHCVGKKHCCNPDHLTPKTGKENQADRIRDGTDARGEKHWNAKLSHNQVLEIREKYKEKTLSQLAEEYSVCFQTISFIINRKTWTNI